MILLDMEFVSGNRYMSCYSCLEALGNWGGGLAIFFISRKSLLIEKEPARH